MTEKGKGSTVLLLAGIIVLAAMVGMPVAMQTPQWVTQASSNLNAIIFGETSSAIYISGTSTASSYVSSSTASSYMTSSTSSTIATTTAPLSSLLITLSGNFGLYDANGQPVQVSTLQLFEVVPVSGDVAVSQIGYDVGYTVQGSNIDWSTLQVTWQINGATYQGSTDLQDIPDLNTGKSPQATGSITGKHDINKWLPSNLDPSQDFKAGLGISATASAYKAGLPQTPENLVVAVTDPVVALNYLRWLQKQQPTTQGATWTQREATERTTKTTERTTAATSIPQISTTEAVTYSYTGTAVLTATGPNIAAIQAGEGVTPTPPSSITPTQADLNLAADLAQKTVQATRNALRETHTKAGEGSPTPAKKTAAERALKIEKALPSEARTKDQIKARGKNKYIFSVFDTPSPIAIFGADTSASTSSVLLILSVVALAIGSMMYYDDWKHKDSV